MVRVETVNSYQLSGVCSCDKTWVVPVIKEYMYGGQTAGKLMIT